MARARTTTDVFNAIAESQRRQILELLIEGEQTVNYIAEKLDMRQPQASKHLRVLREVDLVNVHQNGKQRFYTLHSQALKPMFDWLLPFERLLKERHDRLEDYLEKLQNGEQTND